MRFLYCMECGNLRPRGWRIMIRRCETCGSDMVEIKVKMTKVGPVYYASLAATSVLIVLYLVGYQLPYGTYPMVAATIVMLILAFVDYNISYGRAKEMVKDDEEKRKGSE